MFAGPDELQRLQQLDQDLSQAITGDTEDPRVSFDADIKFDKEEDGTRWFLVTLFLRPKGAFELTQIQKVVYVLHPTFKPNQIAITDSSNGFAMKIRSWGDFHAMAIVVFQGGETTKLVRYLPIGVQSVY